MDEFGNVKMTIGIELSAALKKIGAPSELQQIVEGYGETLEDEEVLRRLREWNARPQSPRSPIEDREAAEQGGGPA